MKQKHEAEAEARLKQASSLLLLRETNMIVQFLVGVPEAKLCLSQSKASIV
jgi:hypothetical protein